MEKWEKPLSEADTGNKESTCEGTRQRCAEYFAGEAGADMIAEAAEEYVLSKKGEPIARLVSDVLAEYAMTRQHGKCTLKDYLALPDDPRVELIDGVIYDMAGPHYLHQSFVGTIYRIFENFIEDNHGPCEAFVSPLDVQLDCDDKTVVQPDVLILCDLKKLRNGHVFGAPDLVVEVLSPSTSKRDQGLKVAKYKLAGVREYWLIDPRRKRVLVYEFEKRDSAKIYGFADTVPVGIYDGACTVDFARIYDRIRFMYETI
ncbi:MAG: Uma2 family endonuclease [Lachnospiraceae bacterium]|nr:Uma2 family endonuclease [Lachnospiraceae bacterium]